MKTKDIIIYVLGMILIFTIALNVMDNGNNNVSNDSDNSVNNNVPEGAQKIVIGIFVIFVIIIAPALAQETNGTIECVGGDCYSTTCIPLRIKEFDVRLVLNIDASVDYTQIIGFVYNNSTLNSELTNIEQLIPLPPDSDIDSNLKVSELIQGREFKRVFALSRSECDGQYTLEEKDYIKICTKPQSQLRVKIETKIFAPKEYSCISCEKITTDLSIIFPKRDHAYNFSIKLEGSPDVNYSKQQPDECQLGLGTKYVECEKKEQ